MSFEDFLIYNIKVYAWEAYKRGEIKPGAYNIKEMIDDNKKIIFLNTIASFCQEKGVEELIKNKKAIYRSAAKYKISVEDITIVICREIGNEAVKQFNNKSIKLLSWKNVIYGSLIGFGIGVFICWLIINIFHS